MTQVFTGKNSKMKISTTTFLIIVIVVTLLFSVTYLAWVENVQSDPLHNKSWWTVSFVDPDPQSSDMSILIENYSQNTSFTYTQGTDDSTLDQKIIIPQGETHVIAMPEKIDQNKTTVSIKHGGETRVLYK